MLSGVTFSLSPASAVKALFITYLMARPVMVPWARGMISLMPFTIVSSLAWVFRENSLRTWRQEQTGSTERRQGGSEQVWCGNNLCVRIAGLRGLKVQCYLSNVINLTMSLHIATNYTSLVSPSYLIATKITQKSSSLGSVLGLSLLGGCRNMADSVDHSDVTTTQQFLVSGD